MRARARTHTNRLGRLGRRWGFRPGVPGQRSWIDLLLIPWLAWIYDATNNLAAVRQHLAEHHARQVLDLERSAHLAPELALDTWLAAHRLVADVAVFFYENVHAGATFLLIAWLWWRRPDLLAPLRNVLIAVNLIALATFWTFPVAPPRMLGGGYIDVVPLVGHTAGWLVGATAAESNQLAALPSLHIAWAVWCTLVLWRASARAWVRVLAAAYPLATTFAVMATGNHWLADCLLGAALTLLTAAIMPRLGRARARHPVAHPGASGASARTVSSPIRPR